MSRTKGPFILGNYKRELVWEEKNWKCAQCGRKVHKFNLTLDHIIPVKVGGPDIIWDKSNLWLLCRECNNKKLSKDKTIIFEMVRKKFFSKGTNYHILYKTIDKCIRYYIKRFSEL